MHSGRAIDRVYRHQPIKLDLTPLSLVTPLSLEKLRKDWRHHQDISEAQLTPEFRRAVCNPFQ